MTAGHQDILGHAVGLADGVDGDYSVDLILKRSIHGSASQKIPCSSVMAQAICCA